MLRLFSLHILFSILCFSTSSFSDTIKTQCALPLIKSLDAQYLFFGEDHRDLNPSDFFSETLPTLKLNGYEIFFLEFFDSADQPLIDQYVLRHDQEYNLLYSLFYDFGYNLEKYAIITNNLIKNNLNFLGIDRRKDIKTVFPDNAKLALRDLHMFTTAFYFIQKNPDKKIVFFNGSSHSTYNKNPEGPSFYELFKEHFKNSKTLSFKFDYFSNKSLSRQRLKLHSLHKELIDFKCKSGFFILTDRAINSDFDYYIFKDKERAFPSLPKHGSHAI